MINSIRAHLAEFGIVAPVGRKGVTELLHIVADPSDKRVPEVARGGEGLISCASLCSPFSYPWCGCRSLLPFDWPCASDYKAARSRAGCGQPRRSAPNTPE